MSAIRRARMLATRYAITAITPDEPGGENFSGSATILTNGLRIVTANDEPRTKGVRFVVEAEEISNNVSDVVKLLSDAFIADDHGNPYLEGWQQLASRRPPTTEQIAQQKLFRSKTTDCNLHSISHSGQEAFPHQFPTELFTYGEALERCTPEGESNCNEDGHNMPEEQIEICADPEFREEVKLSVSAFNEILVRRSGKVDNEKADQEEERKKFESSLLSKFEDEHLSSSARVRRIMRKGVKQLTRMSGKPQTVVDDTCLNINYGRTLLHQLDSEKETVSRSDFDNFIRNDMGFKMDSPTDKTDIASSSRILSKTPKHSHNSRREREKKRERSKTAHRDKDASKSHSTSISERKSSVRKEVEPDERESAACVEKETAHSYGSHRDRHPHTVKGNKDVQTNSTERVARDLGEALAYSRMKKKKRVLVTRSALSKHRSKSRLPEVKLGGYRIPKKDSSSMTHASERRTSATHKNPTVISHSLGHHSSGLKRKMELQPLMCDDLDHKDKRMLEDAEKDRSEKDAHPSMGDGTAADGLGTNVGCMAPGSDESISPIRGDSSISDKDKAINSQNRTLSSNQLTPRLAGSPLDSSDLATSYILTDSTCQSELLEEDQDPFDFINPNPIDVCDESLCVVERTCDEAAGPPVITIDDDDDGPSDAKRIRLESGLAKSAENKEKPRENETPARPARRFESDSGVRAVFKSLATTQIISSSDIEYNEVNGITAEKQRVHNGRGKLLDEEEKQWLAGNLVSDFEKTSQKTRKFVYPFNRYDGMYWPVFQPFDGIRIQDVPMLTQVDIRNQVANRSYYTYRDKRELLCDADPSKWQREFDEAWTLNADQQEVKGRFRNRIGYARKFQNEADKDARAQDLEKQRLEGECRKEAEQDEEADDVPEERRCESKKMNAQVRFHLVDEWSLTTVNRFGRRQKTVPDNWVSVRLGDYIPAIDRCNYLCHYINQLHEKAGIPQTAPGAPSPMNNGETYASQIDMFNWIKSAFQSAFLHQRSMISGPRGIVTSMVKSDHPFARCRLEKIRQKLAQSSATGCVVSLDDLLQLAELAPWETKYWPLIWDNLCSVYRKFPPVSLLMKSLQPFADTAFYQLAPSGSRIEFCAAKRRITRPRQPNFPSH